MSHVYTQPYIVVGALIIRDGKILLVKEGHLPDKGKWNIPAGKLDYGEDPHSAVSREVYEETGLKFKPTAIVGLHSILRNDVPGEITTTHVLRIVYLGDVHGETDNSHGETEDGQPEISEYKWLSPKEILEMDNKLIRYHDLKDYINDYLKNKSYPLDLITHIVQQ